MKYSYRQTRFVEEYLIDGNGAQAAIRAGYSARSAKEQASRLLTYANVRAAIDQKRAVTARTTGVRVADVVQGLVNAVEVAQKRADAHAQIAGWREIGKLLGFYPETTKRKLNKKMDVDPSYIHTWPAEKLLGIID